MAGPSSGAMEALRNDAEDRCRVGIGGGGRSRPELVHTRWAAPGPGTWRCVVGKLIQKVHPNGLGKVPHQVRLKELQGRLDSP